jgi:tetratricopeptide (TPR) repeat protein
MAKKTKQEQFRAVGDIRDWLNNNTVREIGRQAASGLFRDGIRPDADDDSMWGLWWTEYKNTYGINPKNRKKELEARRDFILHTKGDDFRKWISDHSVREIKELRKSTAAILKDDRKTDVTDDEMWGNWWDEEKKKRRVKSRDEKEELKRRRNFRHKPDIKTYADDDKMWGSWWDEYKKSRGIESVDRNEELKRRRNFKREKIWNGAMEVSMFAIWQSIAWIFTHMAFNNFALKGIEKSFAKMKKPAKGQSFVRSAAKLPKAAARKIPSTSAYALYYLVIAGMIWGGIKMSGNESDDKDAKNSVSADKGKKTAERFMITKENYKQYFDETFHLGAYSCIPTEGIWLNIYNDNGTQGTNTVFIGCTKYPKGGNFSSRESWLPLSENEITNNPDFIPDPDKALKCLYGYMKNQDYGYIYRLMRDTLNSASLLPHEHAAIFAITMGLPKNGVELMKFVKKNYANPIKCALKILGLNKAEEGFNKRYIHDCLFYLNANDYCERVKDCQINQMIDRGDSVAAQGTAIWDMITIDDLNMLQEDLTRGSTAIADSLVDRIVAWKSEDDNYITIEEFVRQSLNGTDAENILTAAESCCKLKPGTIRIGAINMENLVESGTNKFKSEDYKGALEDFLGARAAGNKTSSNTNNIAACYYRLGEYQKTIDESAKVLGNKYEKWRYCHAYYNMGLACEKLDKHKEAWDCYRLALSTSNQSVLAYEDAVARMEKRPDIKKIMDDPQNQIKFHPFRERDGGGGGAFGDSRDGGRRKHEGRDIYYSKGQECIAESGGVVESVNGTMYAGHRYNGIVYRKIIVKNYDETYSMYAYVTALKGIKAGTKIKRGQKIGVVQGLSDRYKKWNKKWDHIHFELANKISKNKHSLDDKMNPDPFLIQNRTGATLDLSQIISDKSGRD